MTVARQMQLSDRVAALKPSATLAVSARVKALRAEGHDVVGFGAGEPDFDTPQPIKDAAIEALQSGLTGYAPVPGDPAARRAIAAKLQAENGIACVPEQVVVTVGAKHALYLALQSLLTPERGQQVILPTPGWVSYRPMIELAGGEPVEVPGGLENDFKITPGQLEEAITPDTVAVIVNSPSNPCGTMYTPDELRALGEVLERHEHVTVIADEIYEKLIYAGVPHFSLGSVPTLAHRVVTVNGLSKAFAMTGWRIGYVCAPGDDGRLAGAIARLQSQMTSCITSFCYAAIVEALRAADEYVEPMRQTFARRATLMHGLVAGWPEVRCPRPAGAFYVFPDMGAYLGRTSAAGARLDSSLALAEALLEEAGVAVVPGEDFGSCAASHVRLSFACGEDQIKDGCERIRTWLAGTKK